LTTGARTGCRADRCSAWRWRALILKPKVLLLDEPLGALDKQLREQMQPELRLLQQKPGITFVLVTHDQQEALTLADRIAVMSDGAVMQVDSPTGLYEQPRTRRVASFIGNMNFFPATLHRHGAAQIDVQGLGRMALNGHDDGRPDGSAALIAIRPENLAVHRDAPPTGSGVPGVVHARQYLGGRQMLHIGIAGLGTAVAVAAPGGPDDPASHLTIGQSVWLNWKHDAMLLLDCD